MHLLCIDGTSLILTYQFSRAIKLGANMLIRIIKLLLIRSLTVATWVKTLGIRLLVVV